MPRLIVIVSVDWEGRSLLSENAEATLAFRRKFPEIPFQHFLNPAYFTRNAADVRATSEAIEQILLPIDEHGLHVHAWRSLVEAAGVEFRNSPQLIANAVSVPKASDDWEFYPPEPGYDVPLESYECEEIQRILATSRTILAENGFGRAATFRAGGWMSGPAVQTALALEGFSADCSAVDPQFAIRRFGKIPLCEWLLKLWPTMNCASQPYLLDTDAGPLWQVPNNGGLVDFAATNSLLDMVAINLSMAAHDGRSTWFFCTGFHEETARKFLYQLDAAIDPLRRVADEAGVELLFAARPQDHLSAEISCTSKILLDRRESS